MKSKPQSNQTATVSERPSSSPFAALRWTLLVCLLASVFVHCTSRAHDQSVEWVEIDKAAAPGQLVVLNHSEQTLMRLWFSPSDVDGLWPGAEPEGFERLAPGHVFEGTVPAGWWDVWFENSNGADALLYRTWFGDGHETVFEIRESWWDVGNWIEESGAAESSAVEPNSAAPASAVRNSAAPTSAPLNSKDISAPAE